MTPLATSISFVAKTHAGPTGPLLPKNESLPLCSTMPRAEPIGGWPLQKLPTPEARSSGASLSLRVHVFVTVTVVLVARATVVDTSTLVESPLRGEFTNTRTEPLELFLK